MNVLSLFDGLSCGQIALTNLGCFPDKYYASEVDKFAIQQTRHVFPDTIHIGDVTKVDVSKLDKIDLIIGGSPCQSFSFGGETGRDGYDGKRRGNRPGSISRS